jgi:hypothetical protein
MTHAHSRLAEAVRKIFPALVGQHVYFFEGHPAPSCVVQKLSHLPVSIKTCIAYKFLSRFATDVVKCGTIARRSIAAFFRSMHQSKRPYDDCHKSPRFCSENSTARCQRGVYTFRVVAQKSLIGLPPRVTPETVGLFSRGVNRNESRVSCTGIPSTPDQPVNGRSSQQAPTPWPAGAPSFWA